MWRQEYLRDLKRSYQFVLVTSVYNFASRVSITDLHGIWMYDTSIVFAQLERIAGTNEEVERVLEQEDIVSSETLITFENHRENEQYKLELKKFHDWKASVVRQNMNSPGVNLTDIIKLVNPEAKSEQQATMGSSRVVPLQDKLDNLAKGKVLDVSKIGPDQSNVSTITMRVKSKLVGSARLPIVSSNVESYIRAIRFLEGGEQVHSDDIAYVKSVLEGTRAKQPQIMNRLPLQVDSGARRPPSTTIKYVNVQQPEPIETFPMPRLTQGQVEYRKQMMQGRRSKK